MTASFDIETRAKALKRLTTGTHDRLDQAIMARDPFARRETYVRFLAVQYLFHRDIAALYDDARLDALLPDLKGRRRIEAVTLDIADLGGTPPPMPDAVPAFAAGADIDLPTALGWLYVAEGSNLGAAFLLKFAARLDLNAGFGARHLAPADEGRGLHWRTFTAALDGVDLSEDEEARLTAGAVAAFRRVHGLVETLMPAPRT